jgi:hypothetical protein
MRPKIDLKVNWQGKTFTDALEKNLQSAVTKASMLVIKTTKELLNTPGQNVATKTLNEIKGKMPEAERIAKRFSLGQTAMRRNLKGFDINESTPIRFGGSFKVQKDIKIGKMILHTETHRADRVYWNGYKWTTASEPGKPPHKQIGDLQKSISWEKIGNGLKARVGPRDGLVYARIQELGGRIHIKGKSGRGRWSTYLPPRPYLRPAFQACIQDIAALFAYAVHKTKI